MDQRGIYVASKSKHGPMWKKFRDEDHFPIIIRRAGIPSFRAGRSALLFVVGCERTGQRSAMVPHHTRQRSSLGSRSALPTACSGLRAASRFEVSEQKLPSANSPTRRATPSVGTRSVGGRGRARSWLPSARSRSRHTQLATHPEGSRRLSL